MTADSFSVKNEVNLQARGNCIKNKKELDPSEEIRAYEEKTCILSSRSSSSNDKHHCRHLTKSGYQSMKKGPQKHFSSMISS